MEKAASAPGLSRPRPITPAPPSPYLAPPAQSTMQQLAPRSATSAQDHVSEQILREQLMSQTSNMPSPPRDHSDSMQRSDPASPHSQSGGEQAGGNNTVMSTRSDSDGADNNSDGRKGYGKRELSTSKRAAQNRAAQRAFRQRKEGYIKKLEEQVRDYNQLSDNYKGVQAENYQLRDYIISLQSRLLESQGDVPPPPSNIDGLQPGHMKHLGLPRISEMQAVNNRDGPMHHLQEPPPREVQYRPSDPMPGAKRTRTGELTASQSALQGPSILESPGMTTRYKEAEIS